MILMGATCFAVFTLLAATATGITSLGAYRFLAGIGLGVVPPAIWTSMSMRSGDQMTHRPRTPASPPWTRLTATPSASPGDRDRGSPGPARRRLLATTCANAIVASEAAPHAYPHQQRATGHTAA
jgi:hypothetical protein